MMSKLYGNKNTILFVTIAILVAMSMVLIACGPTAPPAPPVEEVEEVEEVVEEVAEEVPEEVPEEMPEEMPEEIPEEMPEEMPEAEMEGATLAIEHFSVIKGQPGREPMTALENGSLKNMMVWIMSSERKLDLI